MCLTNFEKRRIIHSKLTLEFNWKSESEFQPQITNLRYFVIKCFD